MGKRKCRCLGGGVEVGEVCSRGSVLLASKQGNSPLPSLSGNGPLLHNAGRHS
jgi:hypothetical protein